MKGFTMNDLENGEKQISARIPIQFFDRLDIELKGIGLPLTSLVKVLLDEWLKKRTNTIQN